MGLAAIKEKQADDKIVETSQQDAQKLKDAKTDEDKTNAATAIIHDTFSN